MTTQSNQPSHGLADNMAAQLALLAVAVGALIAIAWLYIW